MTWIRENSIGFIWFIIFIFIAPFISPAWNTMTNVYSDLIFYLGFTVIVIGQDRTILMNGAWRSLKKGRTWFAVLLTILGLGFAYGVASLLISLFPHANVGWAKLSVHDWAGLLAFGLSTIILPPIAEELFFRRSIIVLNGSKRILILTTLISVILFGLEHSLSPLGFLEGAFIGIVFSIPYILTRNIMVTIMAHFLTNLLMNGDSVIVVLNHLSSLH